MTTNHRILRLYEERAAWIRLHGVDGVEDDPLLENILLDNEQATNDQLHFELTGKFQDLYYRNKP